MEEFSQETGWDVGRIAKEAGVSSSAVSQWLGKGSKEIHSINIKPAIYLERATGYSALWLSKGELPKMVSCEKSSGEPQANQVDSIDKAVEVIANFLLPMDLSSRKLAIGPISYLSDDPGIHKSVSGMMKAVIDTANRKVA